MMEEQNVPEEGYEEQHSNVWDNYMEMPIVDGATFFGGASLPETQPVFSDTQPVLSPHEVHSSLSIEGIPVLFPGNPYKSQVQIMENVIASLLRNENSLIESPTGSGKTLALLCAVLAWNKQMYMKTRNSGEQFRRKIYYCTKTHAQVSTVIKELRKTLYAGSDAEPRLKVSILGSRAQMCVNDDVTTIAGTRGEGSNNVDDLCDKLKRNSGRNGRLPTSSQLPTCPYYSKSAQEDFFMTENDHSKIRDIEDLRAVGQQHNCCPFFASRRILPHVDLVICPYNYLISSHIRRSLSIDLQNCVVIFDEGHNLEKALCAEGSMSLSSKTFGEIFMKCRNLCQEANVSSSIQQASNRLFETFRQAHHWMTNSRGDTQGDTVVEGLAECGLGPDMISSLKSDLASVINVIQAEDGPTLENTISLRIQKVITVLEYLYSSTMEDFVLYLESKSNEVKLNIVCINPALVFHDISSQTSSITITSGTLTPLESYRQELNVHFNQPQSLEQAIPSNRYWVAKMAVGPRGPIPKLTYEERSATNVKENIGESLIKICKEVPHGVLVFFPSKDFIRQVWEAWKYAFPAGLSTTILETLQSLKHVVNECDMGDPQSARQLLKQYRERSRDVKGALFLGVHRGKVSEGIDFRDHEARVVINVGIPYAPSKAPEVTARRNHYQSAENGSIWNRVSSFWDWYTTDALRAVNQGLGRSVRHYNDWGAIIMMDPRFLDPNISRFIPPWIENASKEYCDVSTGFETMIVDLRGFVRSMQ